MHIYLMDADCDGTTWESKDDTIMVTGRTEYGTFLDDYNVDDASVDNTITFKPKTGNTIDTDTIGITIKTLTYDDNTPNFNTQTISSYTDNGDGSYSVTIPANTLSSYDYVILHALGKTADEQTVNCGIDYYNQIPYYDEDGLETGQYMELDGELTNAFSNYSGTTKLVVGRSYTILFFGIDSKDGESHYAFNQKDSVVPYLEWSTDDGDTKTEESTSIYDELYSIDDFVVSENTSGYYTKGTAVLETVSETDRYPFNNMYVPSLDDLINLSKVTIFMDATQGTLVNIPSFITSLKKIYCDIPTTRKGEIKISNYNTGVTDVKLLDDNILVLSCGSQTIEEKYNTVADYTNTTIEIYLPFDGIEQLETEKVMNKTITVDYHVDCITGDSIITITDEDETLLYTFTCNISQDIPYLNEMLNGGDFNFKSGIPVSLNLTPYIIIRRTKSSELDHDNNNYKRDLIGNFTGYNQFTDFNVNTKATLKEQSEIIQLLQGGIIL